jgi:hypothetical protein
LKTRAWRAGPETMLARAPEGYFLLELGRGRVASRRAIPFEEVVGLVLEKAPRGAPEFEDVPREALPGTRELMRLVLPGQVSVWGGRTTDSQWVIRQHEGQLVRSNTERTDPIMPERLEQVLKDGSYGWLEWP